MLKLTEGLHDPGPKDHLWDEQRWPNFSLNELCCKCDGKYCNHSYYHDENFLDKLQDLRTLIGQPFKIASGKRCEKWNAEVGGAKNSQHLKRIAVDVSLYNLNRQHVFQEAVKMGFTGIGLAASFIHLDTRDGDLTLWDYGPVSRHHWGLQKSPWELLQRG